MRLAYPQVIYSAASIAVPIPPGNNKFLQSIEEWDYTEWPGPQVIVEVSETSLPTTKANINSTFSGNLLRVWLNRLEIRDKFVWINLSQAMDQR